MTQSNKEIFQSEQNFTMSLNEAGKDCIKDLLIKYSNFSEEEIESFDLDYWYETNNPDSDCDFMNEISGRYTKNGNPVTFTLSIEEHFTFKIIE